MKKINDHWTKMDESLLTVIEGVVPVVIFGPTSEMTVIRYDSSATIKTPKPNVKWHECVNQLLKHYCHI